MHPKATQCVSGLDAMASFYLLPPVGICAQLETYTDLVRID